MNLGRQNEYLASMFLILFICTYIPELARADRVTQTTKIEKQNFILKVRFGQLVARQ
jgi:hypothetical protein